jgi:hypothetical protein
MYRLLEDIVLDKDGSYFILSEGVLLEALIDHLMKTFSDVPEEFLQKASEHPKVAQKLAYAYTQGVINDVTPETIKKVASIKVPKMGKGGVIKKTILDFKKDELKQAFPDKSEEEIEDIMQATIAADPGGRQSNGKRFTHLESIMGWIINKTVDIVNDYDGVHDLLVKYHKMVENGGELPNIESVNDPKTLDGLIQRRKQPLFEEFGKVVNVRGDLILYNLTVFGCPVLDTGGWCIKSKHYFNYYGGNFYIWTKKDPNSGNEVPYALLAPGREFKKRFNESLSQEVADTVAPDVFEFIIESADLEIFKEEKVLKTILHDMSTSIYSHDFEHFLNLVGIDTTSSLDSDKILNKHAKTIIDKKLYGNAVSFGIHVGMRFEELEPELFTSNEVRLPKVKLYARKHGIEAEALKHVRHKAIKLATNLLHQTKPTSNDFDYVADTINQFNLRFKELEPEIVYKLAEFSKRTAINYIDKYNVKLDNIEFKLLLGKRLDETEKAQIVNDHEKALRYVKMHRERWPELERKLLESGSPKNVFRYIDIAIDDEWPEAEDILMRDAQVWNKYQIYKGELPFEMEGFD